MSSVIARSVIEYCKYDRQMTITGNLRSNYKFSSNILVPTMCEITDLEVCVGSLQRAYLRQLVSEGFRTVYEDD